jgi:uroporphyrinogen-III decarboxylase
MTKKDLLSMIDRTSDGTVWSKVHVSPLVYEPRRREFDKLAEACPHVEFVPAYWNGREERRYQDGWGCVWHDPGDWLVGQVVEYPLADQDRWRGFVPPKPGDYADLHRLFREAPMCRQRGEAVSLNVEHGFYFLRLTYLRGFENLMMDIAEENPLLEEVGSALTDYWLHVLEQSLAARPDIVYFGDDLGAQTSLPISPAAWRRYIKPGYKKIFSFLRERGVAVFLHTDGWILDIIPDLIECGVSILNPQDMVNGLDNLQNLCRGKVALELDIDRQHLTFSGTPAAIDAHVRRCVETLGSSSGGLFLTFGAYPGTPAGNVMAVMEAMEKYHRGPFRR